MGRYRFNALSWIWLNKIFEMSGKFSWTKWRQILMILFPIMFAVHAVNYFSYLWYMDIVKNVLTQVNVNRYRLLES